MKDMEKYKKIAKRVRLKILDMIHKRKTPHIGSSLSIVEILVALYFKCMKVSKEKMCNNNRDKFILSKGHGCPALYAVLAEKGFIKKSELEKFAINNGLWETHPTKNLEKGIEVSTGSLGHGLSIGVGMALAGKVDNKKYKVYVLMSDGELNEGSTWEAIMFAGHHKLSNLVALVDCNKIQALGFTRDILDLEPLNTKWKNFGWYVQEINGHNFEQIFDAFKNLSKDKPNVVILHTIKGKGISFMESKLLWHYRAPDDEEYKKALKELS